MHIGYNYEFNHSKIAPLLNFLIVIRIILFNSRMGFFMVLMEKCSACEGAGYLYKIKHYNLSSGLTVKRKTLKICTECNGNGVIPVMAQDNIEKIKIH